MNSRYLTPHAYLDRPLAVRRNPANDAGDRLRKRITDREQLRAAFVNGALCGGAAGSFLVLVTLIFAAGLLR
jgi:hypothetical protein